MRAVATIPISIRRIALVAAASVAPVPLAAVQGPEVPNQQRAIEAFAQQMIEAGAAPGFGIAVVKGDRPWLAVGVGKQSVNRPDPVTAESVFYIASSTKSMVGLASALLARRGIVDLDQPVSRYLPDLRLPPPLDASQITLRALLTHRGGIRNDPLNYRANHSAQRTTLVDLAMLSRYSAPTDTAFQYANTGYLIMALVLERVLGEPWQDVLAKEVFRPLGLRYTSARMSDGARWPMAAPHVLDSIGFVETKAKTDSNMHAAGGVIMSLNDAARWLAANLGSGTVSGRRLLSAEPFLMTHASEARVGQQYFGYERLAYGLGWYVGAWRGDTLVHHFGGYRGARAHISFLPRHQLGVVVLANSSRPDYNAADLLANYTYDVMLGRVDHAAYARRLDSLAARARAVRLARAESSRGFKAIGPEDGARLDGRYEGAWGSALIAPTLDGATLQVGEVSGPLLRSAGGDIRGALELGEPQPLRMEFGPGGRLAAFAIGDARFERALDDASVTQASGAELYGKGIFSTGAYELPPTFTADGRTAYFTVSTPAYGRLHVIMETTLSRGRWTAPRIAPFSGQYGDADPLISPDGQRLFFLSRRPLTPDGKPRDEFDIFYVEREGAGWGPPYHVAAASGPDAEHYASVASDGTLYIAAIRPDSKGRGDIYRVPFVNGAYRTPEPLGPAVNSPDHHDTTPFVAPDQSYVIFSSWGRADNLGSGGDLYVSWRAADGSWSPARNLGPLVNSTRTEYCPVVSSDGVWLYFASERGFADRPLPARLDAGDWNARLAAPGNGLGDTWRIPLRTVLAAHPRTL